MTRNQLRNCLLPPTGCKGLRCCEWPRNSKENLGTVTFPPMLRDLQRSQRSPGPMYTTEPKHALRKPPGAGASPPRQPRSPPPST